MNGLVSEVTRLGPTYVRIALEGDGLEGFEPNDATDAYVNVAIPPPAAPYEPPFDLDGLKDLPREQRPFRRRYTIRRWIPDTRTLWLEFSIHDVTGASGRWASEAKPGDALVFTGPAGSYRPDPGADWHLMAGDESALPAIGASLEAVPEGTPVIVRVVVDGPADEIELDSPGDLHLRWLHRESGHGEVEALADSVRDLTTPPGRAHAFVHGEAEEIRAVRRHLLADRAESLADLSCSPYWKRGMTDEEWRQVKAAWVAEMNADLG
ncbi:MAG: siderophore-interacting protein [Solirubrobacterales bacterium]|nr:siderophore-interacting protein [Solirubrobacterales bacterium]MCB8969598.1 siderophore-interacting protein [Thermoleophilales bacterium]MCO5327387.1 siderophore-interacting protein [Solirubrobacterales bacterium]